MKRIIAILPVIVVVAGTCIIAVAIFGKKDVESLNVSPAQVEKGTLPESETYAKSDQQLIERTFADPEELDKELVLPPAEQKIAVEIDPPDHLEASLPSKPTSEKSILALKDNALASLNSFSSLRADSVRNPDSSQNKSIVQTMVNKRSHSVRELKQGL